MQDQVHAAVQKYVDGCKAADAAIVADAFDENAIMWGYLGPTYVTQSGSDFAANVIAPAEPSGADYNYQIHGIEVTGEVAHAILDEQNFLGASFRNHFGLVRRDGVWRIASKVFTTV